MSGTSSRTQYYLEKTMIPDSGSSEVIVHMASVKMDQVIRKENLTEFSQRHLSASQSGRGKVVCKGL